ncbi:MAG: hypothetical protein P8N43_10430 [Alphaproteobacteria bacterium]|jgi:hypothetical protein|nr:hypothetical protein [Alphaproteobacteria bacterium]
MDQHKISAPAHTKSAPRTLIRFGALALAAVALSACNMTMGGGGATEGIGYRQARFAEMSAMKAWRDCRDQALSLDRQARDAGEPARYLASAKVLEACEANAGPEIAALNTEERMRAAAVASLNYLKGGDLERARSGFETFKSHFGGRDLLFADGSSYSETMDMLLGLSEPKSVGALSVANVNPALKAELRRVHYWERH